ncbi:hypothetical protein [Arthrobacter koreensis]|uniref:hypothetical protein n=1 Tax=Arthrobacter koreensis TaxID=199136 RepID=UPI003829ED71
MTPTLLEKNAPETDPVDEAITALTAAARGQRIVGAGTVNEHSVPVDFAGTLSRVLASVAANVGGIEALLQGRPGSWEADYVRQLLRSIAGENEESLLQYRTEPLQLSLNVEEVFERFGLTELYGEAVEELSTLEADADETMFQETATQQEKARLDALRTEAAQLTEADTTERNLIQQQAQDILLAVTTRAEQAGNPAAAKLNNVVETRELIDELWQQDQDSYRHAYAEAARHALSTRGLTVSLEVIESGGSEHHPGLEDLHSYAEKTAPLPMTGQAPDWNQGKPANALRTAGLTYPARVSIHP